MAVKSKRKRFEVFKRDLFTCQYCGQKSPDVVLECDHVVPVCQGGTDDIGNLITACFSCNRGKAGKSLDDKTPDGIMAMQLEKVAQLTAFNQMLIEATKMKDNQLEWLAETVSKRLNRNPLHDSEKRSLAVFAKRLNMNEIVASAEKAGSLRKSAYAEWKYFCGICWSKIKESSDES